MCEPLTFAQVEIFEVIEVRHIEERRGEAVEVWHPAKVIGKLNDLVLCVDYIESEERKFLHRATKIRATAGGRDGLHDG